MKLSTFKVLKALFNISSRYQAVADLDHTNWSAQMSAADSIASFNKVCQLEGIDFIEMAIALKERA